MDRLKSFDPISDPKLTALRLEAVPFRPIVYDLAYSFVVDFPIKNLKRAEKGQDRIPVDQDQCDDDVVMETDEGKQGFLKSVFGLFK